MAVFIGAPVIDNDRLRTFFDAINNNCYVNGTTEWKMYNGSNFTVTGGIYDPVFKKLTTDGTNEKIPLPKEDTTLDWGKTLSLYFTPTTGATGSYILNDNGALVLYYTQNKKINLVVSPLSHTWTAYTCILIDDSDNITLINDGNNNNGFIIKLDLYGNILKCKSDSYQSFAATYGHGKIVENEGYQYILTYRGYSKSLNFLDNDSATQIVASANLNVYSGDIDVDKDFVYLTAAAYEHKAFKTPKLNPTVPLVFGTGTAGAGLTQLNSPRGISVGTNYVFVSDTLNHRVTVLDKITMTYVAQLGVTGSAGSTTVLFDQPRNNIVKNGNLYVSDSRNSRIKIYDELTLNYIDSISLGISVGYISVNSKYIAVLSDSNLLKVFKLSDKSLVSSKQFTTVTDGPGGYYVYGSHAARKYGNSVFIFDRNNSYYEISSTGLTYGSHYYISKGDAYDVAIDNSYFYITSEGLPGFYKVLKSNFSSFTAINSSGTGDGQFSMPNGAYSGIAVDDNYIYISDSGNNRVQVFNKSNLSFYSKFGTLGSGDINFNRPGGIEIFNGKLYIYVILVTIK